MHIDLLELLADPASLAPLRLKAAKTDGTEVVSGILIGSEGREYPIVGGIPRFVSMQTYADNFGMQWNRFRATQLDTERGGAVSRQRFDNETGWDAASLKDKWVLDVGCGAGRFAEIAAARGARLVAMDLSGAVDATAETLRRHRNVNVIQASALNPPFRSGAFDFAYCIGVVQHTPDRSRVIRETVRCVSTDGRFAFTIYARRPWTTLSGKYIARNVTRRISPEMLLRGLEAIMPSAFRITDQIYPLPVVGRLARFALPIATYTSGERPGWTKEQRYQEALLDTFDALAPRYDAPMTWREVERTLVGLSVASWHFVEKVPIIINGVH
jgi:SAM-dependent methyltransferase